MSIIESSSSNDTTSDAAIWASASASTQTQTQTQTHHSNIHERTIPGIPGIPLSHHNHNHNANDAETNNTPDTDTDNDNAGESSSSLSLIEQLSQAKERADNNQEQLDVLLQAIALISKLASLDYSDHNTTTSTTTTTAQSRTQIQAKLDNLQQQWKLEDTPIPTLLSSIHRLQSNMEESNHLISQIHATNTTLQKYRTHNSKLKIACKKLYGQNTKYAEKIKRKKKESRNFVRTVKDFVTKKKQEQLDTEEFIVAVHETMLKKNFASGVSGGSGGTGGTGSGSSNSVGGNSSGNRPRTATSESAFSDLDAYSYLDLDYSICEETDTDGNAYANDDANSNSNANADNADNANTDNNEASYQYIHHKSNQSVDIGTLGRRGSSGELDYDCGVSFDSSMSAGSSRSLVTDDAAPTVRFFDTASIGATGEAIGNDAGDGDAQGGHTTSTTGTHRPHVSFKSLSSSYTLSFPCSKEIGLQFVQVPSSSPPPLPNVNVNVNVRSSSFIASGNLNRNRAFSDSAVLVGYNAVLDLSVVDESTATTDKVVPSITHGKSDRGMFKSMSSPGRTQLQQIKGSKNTFKIDNIFGMNNFSKPPPPPPSSSSSASASSAEKASRDSGHVTDKDSNDIVSNSQQNSFLVRDFQGFDTLLNVRPTIGARLIAIDDQSLLEGHWTLGKVTEHLQQRHTSSDGGGDGDGDGGDVLLVDEEEIMLTFRNDPLGKAQKKLLEPDTAEGPCPQTPPPMKNIHAFSSPNRGIRMPTKGHEKAPHKFFNVSGMTPQRSVKKGGKDDEPWHQSFFGITITKHKSKENNGDKDDDRKFKDGGEASSDEAVSAQSDLNAASILDDDKPTRSIAAEDNSTPTPLVPPRSSNDESKPQDNPMVSAKDKVSALGSNFMKLF